MQKKIQGKVFVLGDNVDTDQIIPATYLSYNPAIQEERKYFGRYALSGVPIAESGLPVGNIPFIANENSYKSTYKIIIAGKNFGCGSSREHAPLALNEAGILAVVARSFARIFYRNCINGAYLTPFEIDTDINHIIQTGDEICLDTEAETLCLISNTRTFKLQPLGDAREILAAGGIFAYAAKKLLKTENP